VSSRKKKTFTTAKWNPENRGKKAVVYGKAGMGKTTLAALAPKPLFIPLDEGGLDINDPRTGEALNFIPGVETYEDVLDVLDSPELLDDFDTLVIDDATQLEQLAVPYMCRTIPGPKGSTAENIESYGYGKGFQHLHDVFRAVLVRADRLIRQGKNVIFLAQNWPIKSTHPESEDFLMEAPQLSNRNPSNVAQIVAWASHVFRIGHPNIIVEDKKASGDNVRAVFVHPEVWYYAKSRTISVEHKVVSFESPQDDSIWKFLFGGE
jgi:hypothetical protein